MVRILVFCFCFVISVSPLLPDNNNNALADLGLEVRVLRQEETDQLVEDLQMKRSAERLDTGNIQSLAMDSSNPEHFYVGFDDSITNGTFVECFTMDETFQYTITFKSYGSYDIFFSRGMVFLYFARGDWVLAFDKNGNVAEGYELNKYSSGLNDEVLGNLCNQTKYEVDGKTFEVGNNSPVPNAFLAPYSYLKVTEQDGTSHYLYQTSENPYWAFIALFGFEFVIVLIMLLKQKEKTSDTER